MPLADASWCAMMPSATPNCGRRSSQALVASGCQQAVYQLREHTRPVEEATASACSAAMGTVRRFLALLLDAASLTASQPLRYMPYLKACEAAALLDVSPNTLVFGSGDGNSPRASSRTSDNDPATSGALPAPELSRTKD